MINHNGAWLPSVWLGLPAIALGVLLCVAAVVLFSRHAADRGDFWIMAWLPMVGALALIIGPAFGYWPYDGDYHRLQPVTGTVAAVDTRFMAASQYVVITYAEGATVRCDDSRCATVKPGDSLRLLCTREFEYGAVNGWGCRWGGAGMSKPENFNWRDQFGIGSSSRTVGTVTIPVGEPDVDADAAWAHLHDGKTYKVYKTGRWGFRYTVARPNGGVLACVMTLWGARRVINRDAREGAQPPWWEQALVEQHDQRKDFSRG